MNRQRPEHKLVEAFFPVDVSTAGLGSLLPGGRELDRVGELLWGSWSPWNHSR